MEIEHLLDRGHSPDRTIYLAVGHDDEVGGRDGAGEIAALLETRGVDEYALVLDEGGVITEGLIELGLLKGRVRSLISKERYRGYYMHRTGHWLGMDVHDVGDYKIGGEWRVLEPGMVMTVESYVGPRHGGEGVKLEEQVVITDSGFERLFDFPLDL